MFYFANIFFNKTGLSDIGANKLNIQVFPNSAKTQCKVLFTCETYSDIIISLVDISGKIVCITERQKFQSGKHSVDINLEGIPDGVYIIKVLNNEQSFHQKLVISKR
ncbi:MAG: hypothetical protein A2066_19585 [Bacteroidetes bacterium GWB2_41_8]|nr:MAG: hypothetical protein A2066_19585 [Bacteroidetes bacterium GWB2_41_8]